MAKIINIYTDCLTILNKYSNLTKTKIWMILYSLLIKISYKNFYNKYNYKLIKLILLLFSLNSSHIGLL